MDGRIRGAGGAAGPLGAPSKGGVGEGEELGAELTLAESEIDVIELTNKGIEILTSLAARRATELKRTARAARILNGRTTEVAYAVIHVTTLFH
jgi:hypothetical protein